MGLRLQACGLLRYAVDSPRGAATSRKASEF
jgi:hypothetical protein